jgi:hypothetical protein
MKFPLFSGFHNSFNERLVKPYQSANRLSADFIVSREQNCVIFAFTGQPRLSLLLQTQYRGNHGDLVAVMTSFPVPTAGMFVVRPPGQYSTRKVRVLIELLIVHFEADIP